MKPIVPILISSFVSLTAIMALLAFVWPQAFYLVPGIVPAEIASPAPAKAEDSTRVLIDLPSAKQERGREALFSTLQRIDTSAVEQQRLQAPPAKNEQARMAAQDSIKALMETLAQLQERFGKRASSKADSLSEAEARTMAQIFEAMDPASAAQILNNMDDHAVKQVLTTMKKRQSAKILAALDPQQAARILKVKGEL